MATCASSAASGTTRPYLLASRPSADSHTVVKVGDVEIGGPKLIVMAGPCSVENADQLFAAALAVKAGGASVLRGGAFKPRTSPYDFQGLGLAGLQLLAEARQLTGLPIVTEVVDSEDVDLVARYADILQIGSRNMSAFRLLQRAAATGKPILLKRGFQSTIREWLLSAEYILAEGNEQVILCERGIRTFDTEFARNTLDLNAVPILRQETHLPVIVDPSHGTGRADLVMPMAMAGIAAGADGLMLEVHPMPANALCDGRQSLTPDEFGGMMQDLQVLAKWRGRTV